MSWQIPTLIEADIKSGKAQYRTFQTGNGGQSILPVPSNSYVVIFGYDFSPAGGGFSRQYTIVSAANNVFLNNPLTAFFETQQIAFYTGSDFYPFLHHVNVRSQIAPYIIDASAPDNNVVNQYQIIEEIDNTPLSRQVYITSTNDVTITHGLILQSPRASVNPIPVTNRTPQALTYGGSGQNINTQTNFGPAGTPLQFMQPSVKDYADFAFGLLPNNANDQAFATPDVNNGLIDATLYLETQFGGAFTNRASCNYYLNLHYALYTETVPESRG